MTMRITPRLVVADASAAIDFYVSTLGAREVERYTDEKIGKVVHALLSLGEPGEASVFSLVDEHREFHNDAPTSLNGSPVIFHLDCGDPDAFGARMVAAGATVVFPIADQFYGAREGRVRDPFGHLWILSKKIADLPPEEIQRRVDRFHD